MNPPARGIFYTDEDLPTFKPFSGFSQNTLIYIGRTFFLIVSVLLLGIASALAQTTGTPATPTPSQAWQEEQRKIFDTFARLDESNNFTESLAHADMNVLPIGIKNTVGNIEVTLAVSDMRWEVSHTALTIFAKVNIPQSDGKDKLLFFGAQGIKLSSQGDIIGDASLVLMGDFSIPIFGNTAALTLKGSFDKNTGNAKELTYVSVDCQGFKELGIKADLEFPESLMKPVDATGKLLPGRVKGTFNTVVKDWNDLLASIALPPFEIVGLKGFNFTLGNAVFDFSDLRNDPAVQFPEGYANNYLIPGNPSLWRGVFVKDLVVTLPKPFTDKSKVRPSFSAVNMLIDNNGISGKFKAAGILPIDKGSASGWRFSVDVFTLALEANRLTEAGFSGLIGLPISEKSNLGYDALITADDEYMLRVKPMDTLNFDVFNAQAQLLPNSYVELKVVDDQFKPEAMLHGSLNLAARLGSNQQDTNAKAIAKFNGIEFRSLHLKTESPKFTAEYFGYKGELKMMNFPISVQNIGVRILENELALGIDIKLTLSDNQFAGSTRLEFVSKLEKKVEGGQTVSEQWKFDKVNISNIAVEATIAETFYLKAGLTVLSDDPVYGDGYAGNITLRFKKVLEGTEINARAIFGHKDFRYWFVDGNVKFTKAIPVFPPVGLNGFGGGVYSRMKRVGASLPSSPTGCQYIPDKDTGFGIKAAVFFVVANDAAVSGEASFEVSFNKNGGLNFIGFYGFAKFVGKIPGTENIEGFVKDKFQKIAEMEQKFVNNNDAMAKQLQQLKQYDPNKAAIASFEPSEKPGEAGFSAALGIQYDFTQNSLHATFDLYVNAINGLIRGNASGNRAGWAVLHIDKSEWYIHMGTPTDRLGLKMGVAGVSVETGSYLMLGSRIPASPPPPQQVADILGVDLDQLDYMRDLNALGDGRGFAFGSSLRVATGDITFLVLYANFQAGLGFDIMLKDYQDMECKGRSGPIGINGWYANGQSYAYLQGELGIKVNLWFIKAKIPIIKGAAATLLQAKLPNPVWFKGYMAVRFSVLGGLVSGRCRFKFSIGEECELVIPGGSPLDVRMISDITPKNKSEDVDVFTAPQVTFNMRVDYPFEIEDDKGVKEYRIHLNEFSVLDDAGKKIPGEIVWTEDFDAATFYSSEVLPPNKDLKAIVRVGFEEWKNGNWKEVYTSGVQAQEIMEVVFKTGTAPEVIPIHNIELAYPIIDQRFFLKNESTKGFVQLKRGQSYLFPPQYKHEVHLVNEQGEIQAVSFQYNSSTNRLDYTLPAVNLQQSYHINVVSLNGQTSVEAGVTTQNQNIGDEENEIALNTNQAASVVRSDIGKVLLDYAFSSSRHESFAQKIQSIKKGAAIYSRLSSDVINLQYEIQDAEPFEILELTGNEYSGGKPLISATAQLNNDYYTLDIFPLVYQGYPVAGLKLARTVEILGAPPVRAIPISTAYLTEVEDNNFYGVARTRFPYIYNLPAIYREDFVDMQQKIVSRFSGTPEQSTYSYIINGYYKFIRMGYYTVDFRYTLPDGTTGTQGSFEYYNFIK